MIETISPADAGMDEGALARLDASVQADIDAGRHYGAAMLVARGGKIVHRANLGTVAPGRAAARSDRYLLMSMSKAFTAVLVQQAIEKGRFNLDTRVANLLPGFERGGKETATVAQLLCHTAGLPTALVPPPVPLYAVGDLDRKAKAISRLKAVYAPGTRCAYTSGTGYDALGQLLVETDPKGRSFSQIAKEDLFDPLGMQTTSFGLPLDHPLRVPVSFTPANVGASSVIVGRLMNEWIDATSEFPAGAAFAQIDDVLLFTEALIGRPANGVPILKDETFAAARQNFSGDLKLETIPPVEKFGMFRQMLSSVGPFQLLAAAKTARGGAAADMKLPDFPANFTGLGGYVRGVGDFHSPAGRNATPTALAAVGGGSTGWMVDTERDLTFIFLSAGLIEGMAHPERLSRLADLVIAAVKD